MLPNGDCPRRVGIPLFAKVKKVEEKKKVEERRK
jgi:hypothetical protein